MVNESLDKAVGECVDLRFTSLHSINGFTWCKYIPREMRNARALNIQVLIV